MLSTGQTDGRMDGRTDGRIEGRTERRSAQSDVKFHPEEQRGKKMCAARKEGRKGERDNIPRKISTESLDEFKVVEHGSSLFIVEE